MLESLLETTIKKKGEIHSYFENIQNNINTKNVEKAFNTYAFAKNKQDKTFAAIDGSFNKKKFMACFIYAVGSQTIISKPQEPIIKESAASDISTITSIRTGSIDRILSSHMNILELKSTIDTMQRYPEIDYMLMDGSIRGTLQNFDTNYSLDRKIYDALREFGKEIEDSLKRGNFPLEVTTIARKNEIRYEIEKLIKENNMEIDYNAIESEVLRYMEGLEQLECIYVLLEQFKEKIICVSKTSSTHDLFNESIPDAAVLEYAIQKPGYTNMNVATGNKLVRRRQDNRLVTINYPIHNTIFSSYDFSVLFAKLERRSNILKLEIPYKVRGSKIEGILNDLYSSSVEGYPFILAKAHDEVKIRQKDMSNIIKRLEIFEKTGRDMLE